MAQQGVADALDRYFLISQRGSTIEKELRAGLSTFLTIAYILAVNPHILNAAGLPIQETTASTAISSAIASLLCGLVANLPFAIAPGMGLNAYMAFNQVVGLGVTIPSALACCFAAALLVALLAGVRALSLILSLVPNAIKLATVLGMGLLLALIGMQSAGIVVADTHTMVGLGDLMTLRCVLAAGGLALIAALHHRQVKGSLLIGITATALAYWAITSTWPAQVLALPVMQVWGLDFAALQALNPGALSAVVAHTLVMIFDIGGAMYGLASLGGIIETDGSVPGAMPTYFAAAVGTAVGALTGTSPLIIAAESAVGVKEGGRTGLVAVTVSLLFAASVFFVPLMQALPEMATAPVLVLVGAMMMSEAGHVDWSRMTVAVPAFLTMVVQPFTFSIANGIYAGLAFSFILFVASGDAIAWARSLLYPKQAPVSTFETKFSLASGHSFAPSDGNTHEPLLPYQRPSYGGTDRHSPLPHIHTHDYLSHQPHLRHSYDSGHGHPHAYPSAFAAAGMQGSMDGTDGLAIAPPTGGLRSPPPGMLSPTGRRGSEQLGTSAGRIGSWLSQPMGPHCSHCGASMQPARIQAYLSQGTEHHDDHLGGG